MSQITQQQISLYDTIRIADIEESIYCDYSNGGSTSFTQTEHMETVLYNPDIEPDPNSSISRQLAIALLGLSDDDFSYYIETGIIEEETKIAIRQAEHRFRYDDLFKARDIYILRRNLAIEDVDGLIDINECAQLIGVTTSRIHKLIISRRLTPARQIPYGRGHTPIFVRADIDAFIKDRVDNPRKGGRPRRQQSSTEIPGIHITSRRLDRMARQ